MLRRKAWDRARFSAGVIIDAQRIWIDSLDDPDAQPSFVGTVDLDPNETWSLDTLEDFIRDYERDPHQARASWSLDDQNSLEVTYWSIPEPRFEVSVGLPQLGGIQAVFRKFEERLSDAMLPAPPAGGPHVVIGHGHSRAWRELEEHLRSQHDIPVHAFESAPRAALTVREVLDEMLTVGNIALLVHTAEDEQADGGSRARQNVIHETGLFQGRFGWRRAIVLRERGCEEFSNDAGAVEIHFDEGNIQATFGEVVATIRREFPPE